MSSSPPVPVSVFIVCMNEGQNIRRCLESVRWCDEIVVVDSGSTDDTLAICAEFGARVEHRPWPGYVEQKRYGLSLCRNEWVLNLDADEEVSPELQADIMTALRGDTAGIAGFELSRVVFYLGRWWRKGGWYPEYRLRLCAKSRTTWGGDDPHERAIPDGTVRRLAGELRHYTYVSISDHIDRLNKHSLAAARTMIRNGTRPSFSGMALNPITRFVKFYLLKKGFLEGFPGLVVAVLESYYVFLKYVKVWELHRQDRH